MKVIGMEKVVGDDPRQLLCRACGTIDKPKRHTEGSILIEIILWCFFIVPGLIYSIWRFTKRYQVCRHCGSRELIPRNSPIAKKMQAGGSG